MKQHRLARINEVIREVASQTILFELRDPRIKMVTVTRAEVSPDLQQAKVYISVLGGEAEEKLTLHGLRSAAGYIQSKLGDRIKMRYTPVLEFVIDQGIKNSIEIARLLHEEKMAAEARNPVIDTDETDTEIEDDDDDLLDELDNDDDSDDTDEDSDEQRAADGSADKR